MQWILTFYTMAVTLLGLPGILYATELDRYGQLDAVVLSGGEWWNTNGILMPEQAKDYVGQFVVVKGKVLATFRTREDLYLNFGEDYKTDFTVRIPKTAWKQFADMEGQWITVRGRVREYNGPMIVVDFKEQIHAH